MSSDGAPPQPKAILRGHKSQVHVVAFVRHNERLLSGDADGFVVAWDLTIMRPRAVWQAHGNAILGISGWGPDKVITHGRDHKLTVWRLTSEDEGRMSTALPLDPTAEARPKPWMLHMLEVNTMNFCSFASCPAASSSMSGGSSHPELLVAVPNTLASEAVDIYHLPSQTRLHTVKFGDKNGLLGGENGMAMALSLSWLADTLTLIAGYENGLAVVAQLDGLGSWHVRYRNQCHSQPILSLDVAPSLDYFITSSADAIIAKHPLPTSISPVARLVEGSPETSRTLETSRSIETQSQSRPVSGLATLLAAEEASQPPPSRSTAPAIQTQPLKIVNTKHSGQQGVRVRSDGRIFATAGWDSKARVYSAKTMREVAVLKWHSLGCFAVAFADLGVVGDGGPSGEAPTKTSTETGGHGDKSTQVTTVPRMVEMTVKDRRIHQARTAHWLACGSKDGKISLWDIF